MKKLSMTRFGLPEKIMLSLAILIACPLSAFATEHTEAKSKTRQLQLKDLSDKFKIKQKMNSTRLEDYLLRTGEKKRREFQYQRINQQGILEKYQSTIELMRLDETGQPVYYTTENINAARTVSTDLVWPGGGAGLNLTGAGMIIGEWDAGSARATHQEFGGRVTVGDGSSHHYHSTHVGGTIIAAGVAANAQGMAYAPHGIRHAHLDLCAGGERVAKMSRLLSAGRGQVMAWDCTKCAAGIYFARIVIKGKTPEVVKIAIMR